MSAPMPPAAAFLRRMTAAYVERDGPLYALALGLPGAFGVVVKFVALTLTTTGGFLVVSRMLGYSRPDDLPLYARIGLFEFDALWGLLLLPLVASAVFATVPRGLARILTLALAVSICLLLFAALLSVGSVGRLLSASMLADAIEFGARHPEYASQYVSPRSIAKLGVLLAAIVAVLWLPQIARTLGIRSAAVNRAASLVLGAQLLVGSAIVLVAIADGTPRLISHRSILSQSIASLVQKQAHFSDIDTANANELAGFYRSFSRSPAYAPGPLFGAQRDSDVIVIVLETGPMASVALRGGLATLPALGALERSSIVGRAHHSTFPYTSDAVFSIFSGMYPVLVRRATLNQPPGTSVPSALPQVLRRHGYRTYRFAYEGSFESDTKMFSEFGMDEFFRGDSNPLAATPPIQSRVDATLQEYAPIPERQVRTLRHYLEIDLACLSAMLQQVERSKRSGERFMSAFFPIVGHGPWPALRGEADVRTRGRLLIELQDRWIGELLALLRANDWERDTLVVVTADHGIRTRDEDPDFAVGTMTPYSFHVPLLISAPRALAEPMYVEAVTSHIDIEPTLMELLGIDHHEAPLGEGTVVTMPEIQQRTTFLFAATYHGTDGYIEGGRYFMRRTVDEQHFESDRFEFPPHTLQLPDGEHARAIDDRLDTVYAIQQKLSTLAFDAPRSPK